MQVLSLGPDAQQQYLQYCRQYMFAGHPTVPTFDDIRRVLLGWYGATPAQCSTQAQVLSRSQTAGPAGDSARPEHSSLQRVPGAAGPTDAAGAANAAAASSYSLVRTSTAAASWSYRLEPQLAAVVLVLAAHNRCSPGALLDCVKVVEKQMVSVEAGVKVLRRLQATNAV